jgi:hypothetical protein
MRPGGSCHRSGSTTPAGGGSAALLGAVPQIGATPRENRFRFTNSMTGREKENR